MANGTFGYVYNCFNYSEGNMNQYTIWLQRKLIEIEREIPWAFGLQNAIRALIRKEMERL